MPKDTIDTLELGVRNLLNDCAGCQSGQTILLVYETETDGYYDPELLPEITAVARKLGLHVITHGVPLAPDVTDPCSILATKMERADATIFLARLGDQIRFRKQNAARNQIINYALDRDMLASPFGTIAYAASQKLSQLINDAVSNAGKIHVTCPAGTDYHGSRLGTRIEHADVTRKRFPVSVFAPVPSETFTGRIAQNGFLTGTCSNFYAPWSCALEETLFVQIEGNQITGFEGSARDVRAATDHYNCIGDKYGIDTFHVHSWHAGIHPGCAFDGPASRYMERWSGSAFGNPRLLHVHTCGDYPPGEISLNVLDPTIRLDGVALWEDGRLYPDRIPGGAELLATYPDLALAFDAPATQVGQAACGQLRL